ncbi:dual specificity protein phosphatase 14-like isoform X1 [Limanda limanda]|uniref:dual specificity protein phosphatase 14-like isoform X1 n=1 Tax=Limanda limanda TaxID=27771 RepID=UPI0029C99851|nr:dual specificity protein phosphatase 14-like isoform X1 [Limanda limanda]XP_060929856.1 dual specificity protein phosphatase 14-like isoform X1 [Limanda limanda]XP_060929857.1 dual specificity protein phosphatase 14-like isoform X1 [Limanda limanda]XP_060929858.1 dual specificity protein phosphatase 14-like isoform X1 [Limanda limanda]
MAVSQVRPGVFLSDLDSALNACVLSSRNITLVVNASGLEGVAYPQLDLQVLPVPVQDRPHAPLSHYFDSVAERIRQNHTGATLVHCTAGRSRSPALVMAYLMRCEGLSLRRAHEQVLDQRPFIRPNAGFWRQLMDYERTLFGRSSVRMARTSCGVLPEALQDSEDSEALQDSEDSEALQDSEDRAAYCVNV